MVRFHPEKLGIMGLYVLWRLRHNTARPDILAADQPQPIDPLLVAEPESFWDVVHGLSKERLDGTCVGAHEILAQDRRIQIARVPDSIRRGPRGKKGEEK